MRQDGHFSIFTESAFHRCLDGFDRFIAPSGDILQCGATIELQKWIGLSIRVINWGGGTATGHPPGKINDRSRHEGSLHRRQIVNEFADFLRLTQTSSGHRLLDVGFASSVINEPRFGIVSFAVQIIRCDGIDRDAMRCEFDAERLDKGVDARPGDVGNGAAAQWQPIAIR